MARGDPRAFRPRARGASARLAQGGLARYEVSNFARPGFESRHNGKYWDDVPFLGFGMAAHSCRDGRRYWNHDRYATYCRAVEALFTGLRRRVGVGLAALRARYGIDPFAERKDGLDRVERAGLVAVAGDQLRLTDRGVLLSNEVFASFV